MPTHVRSSAVLIARALFIGFGSFLSLLFMAHTSAHAREISLNPQDRKPVVIETREWPREALRRLALAALENGDKGLVNELAGAISAKEFAPSQVIELEPRWLLKEAREGLDKARARGRSQEAEALKELGAEIDEAINHSTAPTAQQLMEFGVCLLELRVEADAGLLVTEYLSKGAHQKARSTQELGRSSSVLPADEVVALEHDAFFVGYEADGVGAYHSYRSALIVSTERQEVERAKFRFFRRVSPRTRLQWLRMLVLDEFEEVRAQSAMIDRLALALTNRIEVTLSATPLEDDYKNHWRIYNELRNRKSEFLEIAADVELTSGIEQRDSFNTLMDGIHQIYRASVTSGRLAYQWYAQVSLQMGRPTPELESATAVLLNRMQPKRVYEFLAAGLGRSVRQLHFPRLRSYRFPLTAKKVEALSAQLEWAIANDPAGEQLDVLWRAHDLLVRLVGAEMGADGRE